MLADIRRALSQQEFESPEQVQAFLDKTLGAGGTLPEMPPANAADRAQQLIYEAWEERSPERRIALAHEALAISADCADAYTLLAEEEAPSLAEASLLYVRAVAAGERAIGPEAFREYTGHFWGFHETRPYMRARLGLALCLRDAGDFEAAATHFRELLRLNPGDNQGVRHLLAPTLALMGRDDELASLLDNPDYAGDMLATWPWTRALLAYRRSGEGEESARSLAAARDRNPYVADYLTGRKPIPRRLADSVAIGSVEDAQVCAVELLPAWRSTPGATDWLRRAEAARRQAATGQGKKRRR